MAGGHGRHCSLRAEFRLDQGGHPGREGDVDVDFRKAEVAAVVSHHPVVVCGRKHGCGAEGVTVDRRHGVQWEGQDPVEQCVYLVDVPFGAVPVGQKPVEVKPIGVELARTCGDESLSIAACGGQVSIDCVEPVRREPVFVVTEVEYGNLVAVLQGCGHKASFRFTSSKIWLGEGGWPVRLARRRRAVPLPGNRESACPATAKRLAARRRSLG